MQITLQITDANKQVSYKTLRLNSGVTAGKKKVFPLVLPILSKAKPHSIKGEISATQIAK